MKILIVNTLNVGVVEQKSGDDWSMIRAESKRCLPRVMLTENFDIKSLGRIRRNRVATV